MSWTKETITLTEWSKEATDGWGEIAWGDGPWGSPSDLDEWVREIVTATTWTKE